MPIHQLGRHQPSNDARRIVRRLGGLAAVAAALVMLTVASGCGGDDQSGDYYCTNSGRTGVHCHKYPDGSSIRPDDSQARQDDLFGSG